MDSQFHDPSTLSGKLALVLSRLNWKYWLVPAVFLVAIAGIAALIVSAEPALKKLNPALRIAPDDSFLRVDHPSVEDEVVELWKIVKKSSQGIYDAEGCENGLISFEGFDPMLDVTQMKTLRLRHLIIDARALSSSLKQWVNLETIVLENVWISGNFSRVYLPNLKKFIFHQYRNGKTDTYKLDESLKGILFFDKSPNKTWDLNRDLLNLNMTIQVTIEGTKILDVEPTIGEININTHTCENIYKNFNPQQSFQLESLSLSWCSVENVTLDQLQTNGDNLKFLFLNNAVPYSSDDWMKITGTLRNLQELHVFLRFKCDWPGYEIYLNVSNLAPSVETLSITNLDLSFEPGSPAQSVKNLSLDSYVGENVVANFPQIFPNVKTVALFNITQNQSYSLIHQVLQVKPELLIVTNLTRQTTQKEFVPRKNGDRKGKVISSHSLPEDSDVVAVVEGILKNAKIPKDAVSFMVELCKENGTYIGSTLTSFQQHFYRYKKLAFDKVDTYADYVTWDSDPK